MQFPCQIARVLNSGVHALSAGGAVRMGGVAQQEGVAVPKLRGEALVDMPCRTGQQLCDLAVAHPTGAAGLDQIADVFKSGGRGVDENGYLVVEGKAGWGDD